MGLENRLALPFWPQKRYALRGTTGVVPEWVVSGMRVRVGSLFLSFERKDYWTAVLRVDGFS